MTDTPLSYAELIKAVYRDNPTLSIRCVNCGRPRGTHDALGLYCRDHDGVGILDSTFRADHDTSSQPNTLP